MPTGYTADVADGKITSFRKFALRCARAFGACITMRDDPADILAPPKVDPDTKYYKEMLDEAKEALEKFLGADDNELIKEYEQDFKNIAAQAFREIEEANLTKSRYQKMLQKVSSWQPPSGDHANLKAFMIEQLSKSIEFDCTRVSMNSQVDFETWKCNKLTSLKYDVSYYEKKVAQEVALAAERTQWLEKLCSSLPED